MKVIDFSWWVILIPTVLTIMFILVVILMMIYSRKIEEEIENEKYYRRLLTAIKEDVEEYEEKIRNMSDEELYNHVIDDYNEEYFASKELAKRGIEIPENLKNT